MNWADIGIQFGIVAACVGAASRYLTTQIENAQLRTENSMQTRLEAKADKSEVNALGHRVGKLEIDMVNANGSIGRLTVRTIGNDHVGRS